MNSEPVSPNLQTLKAFLCVFASATSWVGWWRGLPVYFLSARVNRRPPILGKGKKGVKRSTERRGQTRAHRAPPTRRQKAPPWDRQVSPGVVAAMGAIAWAVSYTHLRAHETGRNL